MANAILEKHERELIASRLLLLAGSDIVSVHSRLSPTSIALTAAQTFSSFLAMFLTLSRDTNILKKAHAELDATVGRDRMPDFGDRDNLPYVNAIVSESLRYHSILPLGLPYCTLEDDEYHGYFIPAGTVILANVWYVIHTCD